MSHQVDLYDLALLGGGRNRAVNTALLALHQAGLIECKGGFCLRAVGEVGPGAHPVERAVLRAVVATPMTRNVAIVRRSAAADPVLAGLEERLVAAGLRWSNADRRRRTRRLQVTLAMAVLVPTAWLILATNKWEGIVIGLLGAAEMAAVARTDAPTRAGWQALKAARTHPVWDAEQTEFRRLSVAAALAIHGEWVLWNTDPALAQALEIRRESDGGGSNESDADISNDGGSED